MIYVTEATKIETLKPGYNSAKSVPTSEVCARYGMKINNVTL